MYNYELILTYKDPSNNDNSDKLYKKEFLDVFNLETYDEKIINEELDNLYYSQKSVFDVILKYISENHKFPIELTPEQCFPFLFSWEYFHITHECIKTQDMYKKSLYLVKLWDAIKNSE